MIANVALDVGTDVEKIKSANRGSLTMGESIAETIAKISEDTTLQRGRRHHRWQRRGRRLRFRDSVIEGLGKMEVIVGLESAGKTAELAELGKLIAQHVAAANPQAVNSAGLHPSVVAREKDVLADKAKAQGKPANVIDKIVESGLKTFYKEVCLLEQAYIRDDKKSVSQVLKEAEAKVGAPIKVAGFVRYSAGRGCRTWPHGFRRRSGRNDRKEIAGRRPGRRGAEDGQACLPPRDRKGIRRGAVRP